MSNTINPKVSVLVVTYNHDKYIRQALDSVLMQETDFDFEIVVADDHSQDSTLAIVEEYQAGNNSIRVLPSERNVGITRNYQRGFAACRGEYIAVLEGDDFWISPAKLKSLVEFLEQHTDCAFCFHRFLRHDEGVSQFTAQPPFEIENEFALLTAARLAQGNFIGNFSACVYRREVIDRLDPALFEMKVYDWMLNLAVAQEGMIGYLPTIMSVYRAHPSGTWSGKLPEVWRPELLELVDTYNKYLDFKFDTEFHEFKSALLAEMAAPVSKPTTPKVSVLLVTYNHEKFIHQALNSLFMQQTEFDFEIVVADDYSDDSTLAIVKEYQAHHPNIRILPTKGKLGITRNYRRGFEACQGEHIAILEGDDYWISPKKLELTSAFLDENPECCLCFHRLIGHDEATDRIFVHPAFGTAVESVFFTASQLARENFIGNFSNCIYRRTAIAALDPKLWKMKVREWPFNIVVAQQGPIGFVPVIMSVYRAHPGGIWSLKPPNQQKPELLALIETYNKYLDFKFEAEFQAVKRSLVEVRPPSVAMTESGLPGIGKPHQWRGWLKPFVPPVVVSLARRIYHRARTYR